MEKIFTKEALGISDDFINGLTNEETAAFDRWCLSMDKAFCNASQDRIDKTIESFKNVALPHGETRRKVCAANFVHSADSMMRNMINRENRKGSKNPDYIKMSYDDGTVYFHMKQNQDVDAFVNAITETRVNLIYDSWFRVDFGIIYEGDITKEDSHFFDVISNYMNSKPYIYKELDCDSDAIIITKWIDSQQCIMRNFIVTTHDIDSIIKKFGNGSETWCKLKN